MKKVLAVLIAILLIAAFIPAPVLAADGATVDTAARTPAQIRAYAKRAGLSAKTGTTYTQLPSLTAPYKPGAVDQKTRKAFLAALNTARYIAGLNEVKWDASTQSQSQAAALVMTLNGAISHFPSKPTGLNSVLYDIGYKGCNTSNIQGSTGINRAPAYSPARLNWTSMSPLQAVMDWINDTDQANIAKMAHRRWCLNPSMGKSSFGAILTPNSSFSAMSAQDMSNNYNLPEYVAWPARKMPIELFSPNQAWTLSVPSAGSSVSVSIVNKNTGKTWKLAPGSRDGYFNIDRNSPSYGIGTGDCIIFKPNGITVKDGDTYDITVSGLPSPFSYSVSFFKLNINLSGAAVNKIVSGGSIEPAAPANWWYNISGRNADLTWAPAPGVDGYEVQRSYNAKNFTVVQTSAKTSYSFTMANPKAPVYFKIRSYTVSGKTKTYSKPLRAAINGDANDIAQESIGRVAGLKAKVSGGKYALTWKPVYGATHYEVQASTDKKSYKTLKNTTSTSYTVGAPGKTTYLRVRAYKLYGSKKTYGQYSAVFSIKAK